MLSIYADHDEAGIAAAEHCGRAWLRAGCAAQIYKPSDPGLDFADVLESLSA
jgi:hypothetical protein